MTAAWNSPIPPLFLLLLLFFPFLIQLLPMAAHCQSIIAAGGVENMPAAQDSQRHSSGDAQLLRRMCKFDSIYQLGDSIADTGNRIIENSTGTLCSQFPYGETYFNEPTGRCSNGLLMIDYVAQEAGLPFLNPYLKNDSDFSNGVNFAVAGATALPTSVLAAIGVISTSTNSSLDVQLDWMSSFFNATGRARELKDALFMVGEIGGDDFNCAFLGANKTIEEAKSFVPDVIQVINDAVRRVIKYGARRVVVPGNFPIGCLPVYLTVFKTNNRTTTYDEFNCIKDLNDFVEYFNERLQHAIKELRNKNPDTVILYADYYNAFQWLFRNALFLGFDPKSLMKACCGVGGEHNYDRARPCGTPGVEACADPDRLVNWDGVHLTQKANGLIVKWVIHDILPQLHCIASSIEIQ